MAITANDLRWFQSERMTDEDDGGGRMTGTEILWGAENQIFDDLSDVDRAAGDVSIRKVYASVASNADDKYLDAGVVLLKPPADPDVSVLAFSTGDFYDERSDLSDRLESQVVRGGAWTGWLWGDHIAGQRAVTFWQRLSYDLPATGQRLELVKRESSVTTATQILWITRVIEETVERADEQGTYQVRMVTCEIAEALSGGYTGIEPSRIDPPSQSTNGTLVYETRYNPGAVEMFGARPLTEQAVLGDFSLKVDSLYTPLIPTAFSETALADVNPGGDTASLVGGGTAEASFTTALYVVAPNKSLYLGSPCKPGTLSIVYSGSTISDDNGVLKLGSTDVGVVDYSNGVCVFNSASPDWGTSNKVVAFTPAARPSRVADTASQIVTLENRGFVWVITLAPIPAPSTLRVAYRANNEWYVLYDQGGGVLRGADSSYGSGTLNFSTGTVTVTTGALPDPDSEIIYTWATPVSYTSRGGAAVDAPVVSGQTANPGVAPGSFSITGTGVSLTDNSQGQLTGTGGVGAIRYATGEWWFRPTTVPAMGAEFTIDYDYGSPVEETFAGPARDGNGDIAVTLGATPQAGSLEVEWEVELLASDAEEAWELTEEFTKFRQSNLSGLNPGFSISGLVRFS